MLAPPLDSPPPITYDLVSVQRGTIEHKITCLGYFVSAMNRDVFLTRGGGYLVEISVAIGDRVVKGDLLAELDSEELEFQIQRQILIIEKQELRYELLQAQNENKYSLEISAIDIQLANLELARLRREIENTRLSAPITGSVIFIKDDLIGQYIRPYQAIAGVAGTSNLLLEYKGQDAHYFGHGMIVNVAIDDEMYTGKVVLSSDGYSGERPVQPSEVIRIKVHDLPRTIAMGDSAYIHLLLEKKEDVLTVPRQVVNQFFDRNYVYVLKDGVKQLRDVRLGITTPSKVEIIDGLDEGDKVIE